MYKTTIEDLLSIVMHDNDSTKVQIAASKIRKFSMVLAKNNVSCELDYRSFCEASYYHPECIEVEYRQIIVNPTALRSMHQHRYKQDDIFESLIVTLWKEL